MPESFPIREIVTISVLLLPGLLLFEKRIIRARHLIYVYLPVMLTLFMLITAIWNRRFSSWIAELLLSIAAATSVMVTLLVIWRIKGVDVDQLDQKRGRFGHRRRRERSRREKK